MGDHKSFRRKESHNIKKRKVDHPSFSLIRKLEKRIGQKELSKIIGVAPRSIRRYKQGIRKPRLDVYHKLKKLEKVSRGLRKTKSINRKRERAKRIVEKHPEVKFFESRRDYRYSDTSHITVFDVEKKDIPIMIDYVIKEGCEAGYFVLSGVNREGRRVFYQTEIRTLVSLKEKWKEDLIDLWMEYDMKAMTKVQYDLVGVLYHAPTVIERS